MRHWQDWLDVESFNSVDMLPRLQVTYGQDMDC